MNENIGIGLIVILSMLTGAMIMQLVYSAPEIKSDLDYISYNDNCTGLDLLNSAECLNNELKGFYKYNLSNVHKKMELPELKETGGVCWHYADWYMQNMASLGYKSERVNFFGDDEGHTFTIAWDNGMNHYCLLDQLNYECWGFKKDEGI